MPDIEIASFDQLSKQVASDFLRTVIFLDDEPYYPTEEAATSLKTPGRKTTRTEESKNSNGSTHSHSLNAKEAMDVFASKGVSCSVIKPINDTKNALGDRAKVAKRADIVILDWKIHKTDGEIAKQIIDELIDYDPMKNPRLHLIIIYTGEDTLKDIASKVKSHLKDKFSEVKLHPEDDYTFHRGHLRICVYAKEEAKPQIADETEKGRAISLDELASQCSREYSKMTAGLISNVAVESLSVLRNQTPSILANLGPEIDPAYLTHRAWIDNPNDAMPLVIELISSEFRSILEENDVSKNVNIEAIESWLKYYHKGRELKITYPHKSTLKEASIDFDSILAVLRDGMKKSRKVPPVHDGIKKASRKFLTKTFLLNNDDYAKIDCKFALLTIMKNKYGMNSIPFLTQGTIFEELDIESGSKYWICLQPRCDCVRIEDKEKFFFLRLDENDEVFDIIINISNGIFKKVKVSQIQKAVSFEFDSNHEQTVIARTEGEDYIFISSDDRKFKWRGEVKNDYSLRIANRIASDLSRVGLDESEWLRYHSEN